MENKYILDANILITAKNSNYPFDIFPSFWEQLLIKAEKKEFVLSLEIYDEILAGEDELSKWLENNKASFTILPSDTEELITIYSDIIQGIQDNETYLLSAKNVFASVADSWLIAHAKCSNLIIVTQETLVDRNCKKRVKIPNVCNEHGIECVDLITFLRDLKFSF